MRILVSSLALRFPPKWETRHKRVLIPRTTKRYAPGLIPFPRGYTATKSYMHWTHENQVTGDGPVSLLPFSANHKNPKSPRRSAGVTEP